MDDSFMIEIAYQDKQLEFEARLRITGYTHKIEVIVEDIPVLFEPDEERTYRALISPEHTETSHKIKPGILEAIAQKLELLTR